ncbi:MAG TPA: hypothetical protein VN875_11965 [Candidatus Binatus sp.]|jgi:hypothetical protein|nr:hypothetical protein [Candidatus Binatus sp.]
MSDMSKKLVPEKIVAETRVGQELGRQRPNFARVRDAFGLLVVAAYFALCPAPAAFGQSSQAGSSSTAAAPAAGQSQAQASGWTHAQTQTQVQAQTKAASEPQMVDQSAPQEQSLGAIARQAKAQKPKTETTKVYTEDKLSGLSGRGVSSVGAGSQGGGNSDGGNSYANSGASAASGPPGNNEAYWRGRANALRDQMAGLDRQIAGIQDEIKKKGAVSVDPMSGASAGVIYIEDRNRQIKQIEEQKEKLQQSLEDLAEEGRKAGADSGWFR